MHKCCIYMSICRADTMGKIHTYIILNICLKDNMCHRQTTFVTKCYSCFFQGSANMILYSLLIIMSFGLICFGSTSYTQTRKYLTYIPTNIPGNVLTVNLQVNNIHSIGDDDLGNLTAMTSLNLERNWISHISENAFNKLVSLQTLNLYNNRLTMFMNNTFKNMVSLSTLNLNYNRLKTMPPIEPVSANLTTLSLSSNTISVIPTNYFENFISLVWLYLDSNPIHNLLSDTFYGLYNLQILRLNNMGLVTTQNATFNTLLKLKTIHLTSNNLIVFPCLGPYVNDSLREIDINHNNIITIYPECVKDIHKLESLNIEYNQLQSLNWTKGWLINIKILKVFGNQLENTDPNALGHLQTATEIYIDGNMKVLPGIIQLNETLERVQFPNGNIECITRAQLDGLNVLRHLDLSGNQLQQFLVDSCIFNYATNGTAQMAELVYLSLENNLLTHLPDLRGCPKLLTLLLYRNKLIHATGEYLTGLDKLTTLDMTNNRISNFSDLSKLGVNNNLNTLDFQYNCLRDIEFGKLQTMHKLKYLYLNGNRLTEAPYLSAAEDTLQHVDISFNNLQSLQGLIISTGTNCKWSVLLRLLLGNNKLTHVTSDLLKQLPKLQRLYLNYNNIIDMPNLSIIGSSLIEVYLDHNHIKIIPHNAVSGLKTIQKLVLTNNNIMAFPGGLLEGMPYLTLVELSRNNLTSFPLVRSGLFYRYKALYLQDNPFNCDDNLCWIKTRKPGWLSVIMSNSPCAKPHTLQNIAWHSVTENQLFCTGEKTNNQFVIVYIYFNYVDVTCLVCIERMIFFFQLKLQFLCKPPPLSCVVSYRVSCIKQTLYLIMQGARSLTIW